MKKIRSARGVTVDFDLLKIKEQIASAPETKVVRDRQDFIEKRLRRRKAKAKPVDVQAEVEVDPKMPSPDEAAELMDEKVEEAPKPKTKQKARKKS